MRGVVLVAAPIPEGISIGCANFAASGFEEERPTAAHGLAKALECMP